MAKSILTHDQKIRIYQLYNDGFSQSDIAKLFKVSQSTIHNAIREIQYELEIQRLNEQMENAMARGVEAAIKDDPSTLNRIPQKLVTFLPESQ